MQRLFTVCWRTSGALNYQQDRMESSRLANMIKDRYLVIPHLALPHGKGMWIDCTLPSPFVAGA